MWFIVELSESSVVFVLDISPLLDLWFTNIFYFCDVPGGSKASAGDSKASAYNEGDPGSIPVSRTSPGEGNGNPL